MNSEKFNYMKNYMSVDYQQMNKIYRGEIYFKFMDEKMQNPKLSQKEICKKIGTSTATLNRIREELNIPSVYRYTKPLKNSIKKRTWTLIKYRACGNRVQV